MSGLGWRNWWRSWYDTPRCDCGSRWLELGVYHECCGVTYPTEAEAIAGASVDDDGEALDWLEPGDFIGDLEYLGSYPENEVPPSSALALVRPDAETQEGKRLAQKLHARLRAAKNKERPI